MKALLVAADLKAMYGEAVLYYYGKVKDNKVQ